MKTVIMAGGKGSRIASVSGNIPKPMLKIGEISVLEREICCLRDQGFDEIILTVSHQRQVIMDDLGDGSRLGVKIEYFIEEQPLGNAGALFFLKEQLREDFLLLNGDAVFDIDFQRFVSYHFSKGGLATLFTHPNSHPYDSGLIIADGNCSVEQWLTKEDSRPEFYRNRVNAGIHMLSPKLLDQNSTSGKVDLDRQILKPLAGTGQLYCYDSPEYVKDMGTPERYQAVCMDFERGIVSGKNLRNRQKAVFLDRDGTINKYAGFLTDIDDFELLPGVSEAVRLINESGYLAIVITNQPVIARGEVTVPELEEIHRKMETLLGREGAYLDAVYYCPHHPHRGYEGEIASLKIDCSCRKPKPGMLIKAAEDFHIDLGASWMIGDGENDVLAGQAAGCRTIRISERINLLDAVQLIMGE